MPVINSGNLRVYLGMNVCLRSWWKVCTVAVAAHHVTSDNSIARCSTSAAL